MLVGYWKQKDSLISRIRSWWFRRQFEKPTSTVVTTEDVLESRRTSLEIEQELGELRSKLNQRR